MSEALRKACEIKADDIASTWDWTREEINDLTDNLVAFAKQQRAEVWRMVIINLDATHAGIHRDDQFETHRQYCESQARELDA